MLVGKPILAGESDSHQLDIIWDLMGSPTPENMPSFNALPGAESITPRPRPGSLSTRFREYGTGAVSLLKELLKLDWRSRINAADALNHPYFKMAPMPADPGDIPTFEDSHELDRRKFHDRQAKLPPAPKGGTVGMGPEAHGANAGFNNADAYSNRNGVNGNRNSNLPGVHSRNGEERRPAWQRDRGLPPRPPPPEYANGGPVDRDGYRDRDRDRRPRSRGGRPPDVDTYIPSYGRDDRPPRERRRNSRDERWHDRERDRRTRSRSRSPIRDRERDRDMYRR